MQVDNSILSVSAMIIFLLYIYFFLSPVKLLELICFSNSYYLLFVVASVALMLIMHSGFILIIGLLLVIAMMLVIISKLPTIRRVEHFYDETGICVDRVLDCYHWPSKHTGTVYRRGKSGGIFPWVEVINHHQFIYKHITYYSLKSFCKANPDLAGAAERALLRSL